jgi:mono/diheme cytochrome c family protein
MKLKKSHHILLSILCSILLGVTLWALYAEYERPWKQYKYEFKQIKGKKHSQSSAKIDQIWIQKLDLVDRCMTCHQGADDPECFNASQPYKTHFGAYMKYHPIKKFGCVLCHEGKGEALTVKAAHGEVNGWDKPILKESLAQASCAKCHGLAQDLPLSAEIPAAPVYTNGWRLFKEYNCTGCHRLSNYERPARIAPSLSLIGSKVKNDWLISWLKNPINYLPNTKMPAYKLSNEVAVYIAEYLMSLKAPPFESPLTKWGYRGGALPLGEEEDLESTNIRSGEKLISNLGCLGCHKLNDKGIAFGPDLTNIGSKIKPEWLYQFLKNPKSYDSQTIIPDFQISDKDIAPIVDYLVSLKSPPFNSLPGKDEDMRIIMNKAFISPQNIEKGKTLVRDLGCAGCHEIEGIKFRYIAPALDGIGDKRREQLAFGGVKGADKNLLSWLKIKVVEPGRFADGIIITRMPEFGFKDKEVDALVTFLSGLGKKDMPDEYKKELVDDKSSLSQGELIIEKYNCRGCHRINKEGGTIGPDLTLESKKSRPEWLYSFLKSPKKIRPDYILKARMPDFNLSDAEVNTIIEYLSSIASEPYPYTANTKHKIYQDDIRNGEKLYHEIFACIGCHQLQGNGGEIGPDHTDLSSRIKREWIKQWLTDPQAIKPDVRMPKFRFKEWEFEAINNYLMTLGRFRFVDIKE